MRVCSPLRIAKVLLLTAVIGLAVYLYLLTREKHPTKNNPLRKNYFARYYSSNTTHLFALPFNASENNRGKELAVVLSEQNDRNLEKVRQSENIETLNENFEVQNSYRL